MLIMSHCSQYEVNTTFGSSGAEDRRQDAGYNSREAKFKHRTNWFTRMRARLMSLPTIRPETQCWGTFVLRQAIRGVGSVGGFPSCSGPLYSVYV